MSALRVLNANHRTPCPDELREQFIVGIGHLCVVANAWKASGSIRNADLTDTDRTLTGLHAVLTALRAKDATHGS